MPVSTVGFHAAGHAAHWLRPGTVLALLSLLLGGCSSLEVFFGWKTRLADEPVTAIAASLDGAPGLGPGQSSRLVITATTSDGRQLTTVGPGHGKVLFDSFTFDARIVQVDEDGVVTLPGDPRLSQGQMPHIHIGVAGHPGVAAELDVPVRYDVSFQADFSGHPGFAGADGFNGSDGMAGSAGTTDPGNPSAGMGPGGNGGDGTDGGDGWAGGPGQPGPAVQVWVRLEQPGPQPLLQVRVASQGRQQLFLVDARGGTLIVRANGGHGGPGGKGGKGGRGGMGGAGSPPGTPGRDGRDGFDGAAGRPGAAGTIDVTIDPAAFPYRSLLYLINDSGGGAAGPAPQIRIEPVAPLW